MKKVLLLGDSIRAWYAPIVTELLKGKCEVYHASEDNGRFAAYSLWQLGAMLKAHGNFDLIHFNNGYWDMGEIIPGEPVHTLEEYQHFLRRIITVGRKTGARLIFATTTPLPEDGEARDNAGTGAALSFEKSRVQRYNEAALAVMAEENVPINDLYSLCLQDENCYKCEDKLHHSPEGNRVCAKAVANAILRELGMEEIE